jgi:hypothetical protein
VQEVTGEVTLIFKKPNGKRCYSTRNKLNAVFLYDLLGPNKILAEGLGDISLCCGLYSKRF